MTRRETGKIPAFCMQDTGYPGLLGGDYSILHTELATIIEGYGNIQDPEQQGEEWLLNFKGIFVHKRAIL